MYNIIQCITSHPRHPPPSLSPSSLPLSHPPFTWYMVCGAWWYECAFRMPTDGSTCALKEGRDGRWEGERRKTKTVQEIHAWTLWVSYCCTATTTCPHVDTVMWTLTVYLVANLHYLRLQCYMYGQQRLFFAQMAIRWWCDGTCTCTCTCICWKLLGNLMCGRTFSQRCMPPRWLLFSWWTTNRW